MPHKDIRLSPVPTNPTGSRTSTHREVAVLRQELQTFKKALETTYTLKEVDEKAHILDPLPGKFGLEENLALVADTQTIILWDKIYFDSFGYLDTLEPDVFKVPEGGVYSITFQVAFGVIIGEGLIEIGLNHAGGGGFGVAYDHKQNIETLYAQGLVEAVPTDRIAVAVTSIGAGATLIADATFLTIERRTLSGQIRTRGEA